MAKTLLEYCSPDGNGYVVYPVQPPDQEALLLKVSSMPGC